MLIAQWFNFPMSRKRFPILGPELPPAAHPVFRFRIRKRRINRKSLDRVDVQHPHRQGRVPDHQVRPGKA